MSVHGGCDSPGNLAAGRVVSGCNCTRDREGFDAVTSRLSPYLALLALLALATPVSAQWCVSPEPILTIGDSGGRGHDLFGVVGAHRMADGGLVVADAGSSQLRFFDSAGRLTNTVGRSGDGPGEFRRLLLMRAFSGDSLFTFDPAQQRASVFGPSGDLQRSFRMPEVDAFPLVVAVASDGGSVVKINRVYSSGETATGVYGSEVDLLSLGPDGSVEARLGTVPGDESYVLASGESMIAGPLVFGRRLLVSALDDGAVVGLTDEEALRVIGPDGETRIPIGHERLRATQDDFSFVMNRELQAFPDEVRSIEARRYDDMPRRDLLPTLAGLLTDDEGRIWVRRQLRPDDPRRLWAVIGPDDSSRFEVRTPDGATVLEAGADYIVAVTRNELDIEIVVVHELQRDSCD